LSIFSLKKFKKKVITKYIVGVGIRNTTSIFIRATHGISNFKIKNYSIFIKL